MTPRRSAPSWQYALGHAFTSPVGCAAGGPSARCSGSAGPGTLRGELLELLVEVRRGNAPPEPVAPDLNADRVRRRDLGERERPGLSDGLGHLRLLRLRQLDVGDDELELEYRQRSLPSQEGRREPCTTVAAVDDRRTRTPPGST